MTLLRIDSSIRVEASVSRTVADTAEQTWCRLPGATEVVRRDLGTDPLPAVWPDALAGGMAPPDERTDEQRDALALAAALVDELLAADALVVAAPMYNFGVPQQIKHWIDLVVCDPRARDVSVPVLAGRPALLVLARGGGYGPGTPRAGWDHATGYLERILGDVWGLDLTTVAVELTAASYDPAMAHLRDEAASQLDAAHAAAAAAIEAFTTSAHAAA